MRQACTCTGLCFCKKRFKVALEKSRFPGTPPASALQFIKKGQEEEERLSKMKGRLRSELEQPRPTRPVVQATAVTGLRYVQAIAVSEVRRMLRDE